MIEFKDTWLYIAVAAFTAQYAAAQSCYYPNGNLAPSTEKPCSTKAGSACCPDDWVCLDNGLCHYPVQDLYERYSCTDKTWNAPGCPSSLCTYGGQASGAESITQCSNHNDNWCCNADAQQVDCCQELPVARPFFTLRKGRSYATIGVAQASYVPVLSAITGIATSGGDGESPETSQLQSSVQTSTSSRTISSGIDATPTSVEPKSTSLYSGSVGVKTIVISASTSPSETTPEPSTHNPSSDTSDPHKTALIIVGSIVGLILGLIVMGFFVYRRHKQRQQKAHPYVKTTDTKGTDTTAKRNHWSMRFLPELEGHPFNPRRSVATLKCPVELEAGTEFRRGASPLHGLGAVAAHGNDRYDQSKWRGEPPRYSPATGWHAYDDKNPGAAELDGSSVTLSPKKKAPSQKRNVN